MDTTRADILAAVRAWHTEKRALASSAQHPDTINLHTVRKFQQTADTRSAQVIDALGITDPFLWESLIELCTNGKAVIASRRRSQ